jgi:hypothetical protein
MDIVQNPNFNCESVNSYCIETHSVDEQWVHFENKHTNANYFPLYFYYTTDPEVRVQFLALPDYQ